MVEYEDDVWYPVDSSCLSHVMRSGPDVYVRFLTSGLEYGYAGAAGEWESLINAQSVGQFYNAVIKAYPFVGPLEAGGRDTPSGGPRWHQVGADTPAAGGTEGNAFGW